jgi:acetyl-CoA decarbonylase/synthase complex subunit delta
MAQQQVRIRTVRIGNTPEEGGSRGFTLEIGGETCLPFHHFEGEYPHRPVVAWEIPDGTPNDWNKTLHRPFRDVFNDPCAWARFAVANGARLLCLNLKTTHPDKGNKSANEAATLVNEILKAVDVPLIIKGPGQGEKQNSVLHACAEASCGERCLLSAAVEEEYKTVVASAIAYDHCVVAETPIDVNLCKQLNILIADMHFPPDRLIIDPLTGGLGYGLEYTYSVMERIRLQALGGDEMMQMPFICYVGQEAWKAKEIKPSDNAAAAGGDAEKSGVAWEVVTATALLYAGADILAMRHPGAIRAVEKTIDALLQTKNSEETRSVNEEARSSA